jgi:hypothetical protein
MSLLLENILVNKSDELDHGICHDYEWILHESNIKNWNLETYFDYFNYFNNTIRNISDDTIKFTNENTQAKNDIIEIDILIIENKNKLEQLKVFVNKNGKIIKNLIVKDFNDNEKNVVKNTKIINDLLHDLNRRKCKLHNKIRENEKTIISMNNFKIPKLELEKIQKYKNEIALNTLNRRKYIKIGEKCLICNKNITSDAYITECSRTFHHKCLRSCSPCPCNNCSNCVLFVV